MTSNEQQSERLAALRARFQSAVASLAWRHELRAIVVIAVMASIYAAWIFAGMLLHGPALGPADDALLRNRISGPSPSAAILIVDIDERSLALMSARHGRWPWPREVLAEGLEKIQAAEPRAVLFNVMISDPDLRNADGDALLEYAASQSSKVVFPVIRLDSANDSASQLKISELPGTQPGDGYRKDATIAAIIPGLPALRETIGVANLAPDEDGIVRRYDLRWLVSGWKIPSLVDATLAVSKLSPPEADNIVLNWRNKRGSYERISFVDLLDAKKESLAGLHEKFIIVGATAPGVGQVVATSVSPVQDSNVILATALDDSISGTYLRTVPPLAEFIISLVAAWILVFLKARGTSEKILEFGFYISELGLGALSRLLVSYTNVLIDLSGAMGTLLAVFGAMKITSSLSLRWSRAAPGYRQQPGAGSERLVIVALEQTDALTGVAANLEAKLRQIGGWQHLIVVDDLFTGDSLVADRLKNFRFHVIDASNGRGDEVVRALAQETELKILVENVQIGATWNPESSIFANKLAQKLLEMAGRLLDSKPEDRNRN